MRQDSSLALQDSRSKDAIGPVAAEAFADLDKKLKALGFEAPTVPVCKTASGVFYSRTSRSFYSEVASDKEMMLLIQSFKFANQTML